ncbi:hypothetical protein A2Y85_01300 [candidate division WOR-3 bacterium RBG_13_43_14]|uniref:Methylenetetrahydrofolate reductase n=1 Tax=candidate division WOR-3 bacterium RBG_13_43_14 TaxID=1802590 RepID=A0A1F4UCK3_UNCW3|nr:MAG: hypothetical protein A2Y85_01300 [candidate division WOR-3 bacterium RBG_13_43_14]
MLRDQMNKRQIITVEILVPTGMAFEKLCRAVEPLKDYIDAFNIPSNPLGRLRPDAMCSAHLIQEKTGVEAIPHFVARHFTSLGFESHLLGAAALDIKNILCVTGDSPEEGRSTFELNAVRLISMARGFKNGLTSARRSIEPIDFCISASFNPNVPNVHGEFLKVGEKVNAGAEVFFTQPVFDPELFLKVIGGFKKYPGIKIIAGLSYLYTKKRAFALMKYLGIPYDYIKEIEEIDETELLLRTAGQIRNAVDGFYIIPIAKYDNALTLVKNLRNICR